MLGSAQDAEDAVQETLLAAWQAIAGFEGRSSILTWLYQIATNRCLDALRASRRRPPMSRPPLPAEAPEPNRTSEVMWMEPYPDLRLDGLIDQAPGPEARIEAREAISLAFVTALQLLPPRQRAVLILRDVLGFHGREVAQLLDTTEESVSSALKRARSTLRRRLPRSDNEPPPPAPDSPEEREVIERLTHAYETGDVQEVVALLTEDAVLTTALSPAQYAGRDLCARVLSGAFGHGRTYRLIPTRA